MLFGNDPQSVSIGTELKLVIALLEYLNLVLMVNNLYIYIYTLEYAHMHTYHI